MRQWIRGVSIFLAASWLSPALSLAQAAKDSFPEFCEQWMQKLAERERRNQSLIEWREEAGQVKGTYIGYSSQHQCVYKEAKDATPLGKITYLEVRYEKRGATRQEAERNPPQAVETTEVTEIFRFAKGKWVY
jgi:hypothetical protein